MKKYAVLSVDFELFEHSYTYQRLKTKPKLKVQEKVGIKKLLDLFEKNNVNSTFFTVGNIANKYPELLKLIVSKGHEIASHSMNHPIFSSLTLNEIENEIKDSKKTLEKITNEKILGFRAPAFYINADIAKILDALHYMYDSSIVPSLSIPKWYGIPKASIHPIEINMVFPEFNSNIMEVPIAINPIIRMPISGAWMRLFGVHYTMIGIKSLLKKGAIPILYMHPWELVDLPIIKGIPWRVYYRTGEAMFRMVKYLVKKVDARFVSVRELIDII